ncbi:hypothetical protein ACHAXN_005473 [Cyclotella atomus]
MVKPYSGEMYPNPPPPPHHGWSQPPPPSSHSPHPSYHSLSYHYGPPLPPPPPTSSHHHRYPPHHHGGHPRSPHHGYYVSGRGPHHTHRHADVPSSSPAAQQRLPYTPQTIHPAQVISPRTPRGPSQQQPPPPITHRHSSYTSPSSSTPNVSKPKVPIAHKPNNNPSLPSPLQPSNLITTKPPRPYTEYTMFYQLEREFILHRLLVDSSDPSAAEEQKAQSAVALFKNDPLMPARYRTLPLRADWYISGKSKKPSKRKHRKTHGKIGFLELTRMIAARWAKVDDETRKYCKMMAAMELVKYKEDVESYNAYKARLEKVGQVPEDVKEKERKKRAKDRRREKLLAASAAAGGDASKERSGVASGTRGATRKSMSVDQVKSSNVDNDIEQFITSVINEDDRNNRKRSSSPPPLPAEAPWNHFMPGPREHHRHHEATSSQGKVITPERSAKRRRLPIRNTSSRVNPPEMTNGPVSPDDEEDELIRMTFSGIDEDAIAREFYFPSPAIHSGVGSPPDMSPGVAHADHNAATLPMDGDGAAHPTNATTEGLYGPPVQSFDYWDALMDPPVDSSAK